MEILQQGDDSGNDMLVRFQLPSGLTVFGLPTENFYGGHWDLGPTWNYVVMTDTPFLVDSGRRGQGAKLIAMLETIGLAPDDLDFVLISHGHEDHDGGLGELSRRTGIKIKAHRIYGRLIRRYPELGPEGDKHHFPAKCWHCFMPPSFFKDYCLAYHGELEQLRIEPVYDGCTELAGDIRTHHLPGHSPDCLAVQIGNEGVLVGDIILPDISPWPTRKALFDEVAGVIEPEYRAPGDVFGLQRYLISLSALAQLSPNESGMQVFPAHRLFYQGRWNGIELKERVAELTGHHIQRCGAILDILTAGPKTATEIARDHFEPDLLKGFGQLMAENEIVSHCELLLDSGDIMMSTDDRYEFCGTSKFENLIRSISRFD